MVKTT